MKIDNAQFFKFKVVPSEGNELCLQIKLTKKYKKAMKKLFKSIVKLAEAMEKLGENIPDMDFQIRNNEISANLIKKNNNN